MKAFLGVVALLAAVEFLKLGANGAAPMALVPPQASDGGGWTGPWGPGGSSSGMEAGPSSRPAPALSAPWAPVPPDWAPAVEGCVPGMLGVCHRHHGGVTFICVPPQDSDEHRAHGDQVNVPSAIYCTW